MQKKQRGVTMIGWLFLLTPVAIVLYAGIRLTPIYLNYTKVARSMEQTAKEARDSDTPAAIRYSLDKRIDIEGITFPETKDFVIRKEGRTWVIEIDYEDGAPLISNLSVVAKFSKSVRAGVSSD